MQPEVYETRDTKKLTDFELIKTRLSVGRRFMEPYARKDQLAIWRLLDPSTDGRWTELNSVTLDTSTLYNLGLPLDVEKGQLSYLLVNLLVKVHATAISDPAFDVKGEPGSNPEWPQMVREGLRVLYEEKDWLDLDRATLFASMLSGHGFQRYYWDENGPDFDCVNSWDLCVDPHVTRHGWHKLRYGAFRIRLPWEELLERYPSARKKLNAPEDGKSDDYAAHNAEVWLCYDKDTECHIYNDTVELYRGPNHYEGQVPLLTVKGEINLHSAFRLGDADLAAGVQKSLTDSFRRLQDDAENGGSKTIYNREALGDEAEQNDLTDDKLGSLIGVSGIPPEEALHRIQPSPINPSGMEWIKLCRMMQDEVQSVNEYMRGVRDTSTKTATEAALLANQSGSRLNSSRKNFERFLNRKVDALRRMLVRFGRVDSDSDWEIYKAFKTARSIRIVEASTNYKDPNLEQQSALQLAGWAAEVQPLMMTMGSPLNLKAFSEDVLRAYNRGDLARYFMDPQQAPQAPHGKPPIESISYKDAPPDIRRQMEQQAGMQPSQMEAQTPAQVQALGSAQPATGGPTEDPRQLTADHAVDLHKQNQDQEHEIRMAMLKAEHERQIKMLEMAHQAQQGQAQRETQIEQAKLRPTANAGGSKTNGRK